MSDDDAGVEHHRSIVVDADPEMEQDGVGNPVSRTDDTDELTCASSAAPRHVPARRMSLIDFWHTTRTPARTSPSGAGARSEDAVWPRRHVVIASVR
jgi:hypothetical protein